ncbi:hypothetical protein Cantr_01133 [Candida viswanathii]|uniref:Uncharacterized protein n=1 Tax=Candida viswanathii TaxID=5486 RepID=A0A367YI46_9ASCO|nr:hypothetical protein Cantr_01133 [Candida viswanathii]
MRSEQVLVYKHMTKFSVKAETEEVLDVSIEFKLTNQSHYSWLVGYLKRNVLHRKVSINSTLQVSLSQAEELQLRNSMQLEPFVGIKKRKFSRYGSLDEVSERRPRKQMRRSIMVKQDCPTQQSADEIEESSCGVADKLDVKDNERRFR